MLRRRRRRNGTLCAALAFGFVASLSAPETSFAQGTPSGPSVLEAGPVEKKAAQARYNEGAALFARGRFEEALESFRTSYSVVASPNSRLMIARCLIELKKPLEAHAELQEVEKAATAAAASDPRYAQTADKARVLREELVATLARVRLKVIGAADVTQAAIITIDGVEIPVAQWQEPRILAPGAHEITGTYYGEARAKMTETLTAGDDREIVVDLGGGGEAAPPPLPPSGPTPVPPPEDDGISLIPFAATAGGVGVAGLVLFAIAGTMNASTHSDLEAYCGSQGQCPSSSEDPLDVEARKSEGKTQQTLANVGLVIGLSGLAIGAALLTIELVSDDSGSDVGGPPSPRRAWLGVGPSSIAVNASF